MLPSPSPRSPLSSDYWRVALSVPDEAMAEAFAAALTGEVDAVSTFELEDDGPWLVEGTKQGEPNAARISVRVSVLAGAMGLADPELEITPLPPLDWLTLVYRGFPPLRIGRFFIYGSHYDGPRPAGAIPLLVDAATAFGTGEHATTCGCLLALDRLARRLKPARVLDMGCGSGILSIAAVKLWHKPVLAVDIDDEAVRVTRLNARRNQVGPLIEAAAGNAYQTPAVSRQGSSPLIVSNILARPLARLAPFAARHLEPGGTLVLSGLLTRHAPLVIAAHRAHGLRLISRHVIHGWETLVMQG